MVKQKNRNIDTAHGLDSVSDLSYHGLEDLLPPSFERPRKSKAGSTKTTERRLICNQACILHVLGFAIIFGVPFLNVVLPTLYWLWKKEQHQFIAKTGREVINFHISFSFIQIACLFAGVFFIRSYPASAAKLFAYIKVVKIVFATGMYVPFNVFTVVPFFWACIAIIRGATAAYNGRVFKYPVTSQFLKGQAKDGQSEAQVSFS